MNRFMGNRPRLLRRRALIGQGYGPDVTVTGRGINVLEHEQQSEGLGTTQGQRTDGLDNPSPPLLR